jgi:hypothetical protein
LSASHIPESLLYDWINKTAESGEADGEIMIAEKSLTKDDKMINLTLISKKRPQSY